MMEIMKPKMKPRYRYNWKAGVWEEVINASELKYWWKVSQLPPDTPTPPPTRKSCGGCSRDLNKLPKCLVCRFLEKCSEKE